VAVLEERQTIVEPNTGLLVLWRRVLTHYLVRRLLKAFFTIFFVASLTFILIRLIPGSPVDVYISNLMLQNSLPYEAAKQQAASLFSLDLDAPLHEQYLNYLGNLARGDLGDSLINRGTPVSKIILHYLPWTLFSVGTGLMVSFTLGIALGTIMAYKRDSVFDHALTSVASALNSIPDYLIGILIVVWLGVQWKLFNFAAMRGSLSPGVTPSISPRFLIDALHHAALPITTYVLGTIGLWMLTMRSSTESTLGEDYVTVAKARGLRERRLLTAYVGRNAALPLFTQFTISLASVVGGSLVIEWLFVYQGIGYVLYNSIQQRDYPVMQGVFLIITSMVVLANLVADLVYSLVDPRIRTAGKE
jgi:peptide/nickel transport system permease protein